MNKTLVAAAACLSIGAITSTANAQTACPPGSWLCASASVTMGMQQPTYPVAQPVYVQQPQPIYVQQPQPIYVQQPQPVYIQQPTRIYVQPVQPVRYYVQPRQMYYTQPSTYYFWSSTSTSSTSNFMWGGGVSGGAAFFGGRDPNRPGVMGLVTGFLRARTQGYVGGEVSVGWSGGRDWNGDDRSEVPASATGIVYFNPQHRVQLYGLLGANASWARVQYSGLNLAAGAHGGLNGANYLYVGGHTGLGVEYQVTSRFVLFADARGFLRTRIDGNTRTNPEFAESQADGTTRTTNTSMGIVTQLGAMMYF